jgi:hypothetical protein
MHWPLQAIALSVHMPAQTYWLALEHLATQLTPSHVTVPPVGAVQTTPQVWPPQLFGSCVLTHLPPHEWNPLLQASAHVPFDWQLAVPFGSVGHTVQLGPQAVASSFAAQVAEAPVPHLW